MKIGANNCGIYRLLFCIILLVFTSNTLAGQTISFDQDSREPLLEVNEPPSPADTQTIAIIGARLVDGLGGSPITDSVVIIKGSKIAETGTRGKVEIPEDAERYNANGKTLMPGLIDAHYHSVNNNDALYRILNNGITSLRDPGHPFRFYQSLHFAEKPLPRVFLTGAHLDGYPSVYRQQAVIVKDAQHARQTVYEHVENGGTGIKTYFNLPLKYYRTITEAASQNGIPVMAHLELVDADKAIEAGIDGIEHITSFGTALADPEESQRYKKSLRDDYNNRREGRFKLWASIDLHSERVQNVIKLAAEANLTISPTLALFEHRESEDDVEDFYLKGYQNMVRFVGMAHKAGINIIPGSHTAVRYADSGWAYQREMEVLVEAGMSPMDVIISSTMGNARYFRTEKRLGSIEPGKLADLLIIDGDPLKDITSMLNIDRVMLNGEWVGASL
ncbi:MAG: amidohydrolase family protein [Balneolales bacterium]